MILCPICQTENDNASVECILCGAPLPETPASAAQKPASPSMTSGHFSFAPSAAQEPPRVSPSQQNLLAPLSPIPFSQPIVVHSPVAQAPQSSGGRLISHVVVPTEAQQTTRSPEQTVPSPSSSVLDPVEIPPSGTLCLIVYFQRRPAFYFPVVYDEILIGRTDPASGAYPDLDVTPFDTDLAISRKHSYLYREQNDYYIYPISNSGTQVNQEMVDIGTKRKLKEGDVLILSGRLAIRFARVA